MSKVKLNTKITSFTDVQKSLQSIEKYLNELSKSVNAEAERDITDKDGKTGDIKTTRNADGTYTFEIRTEEGWKTPSFGENLIKFKDKSSSFSKNKLESIEEIVTNDDSTGNSKANLTSFDEKNNKFILPRPDYESGWLTADADTTVTIEHNLGSLPSITQVFASDNSAPVLGTNFITSDFHSHHYWGYRLRHHTADIIKVFIGHSGLYYPGEHYMGGASGGDNPTPFTNGYIKVKLWK